MKIIYCLFLFLLINFLSCQSQAQESLPLLQDLSSTQIDSVFFYNNNILKLNELDSFINVIARKLNGTVLIMRHDTVLAKKTVGKLRFYEQAQMYKNWTKQDRIQAYSLKSNQLKSNTFFELASLSKEFTAVAVLQMVEANKLQLTDSMFRFFPNFPYPNLTIHHLLSHISGIPDYIDYPIDWFDTSRLLTNQELISIIEEKKPALHFQAAQEFEYSNSNYVILAAIVEQVADLRFEDYVREHLFLPAGMNKTFFITEIEEQTTLSIAKGHLRDRSEVPRNYLDGTIGDKGIYSNAEEMYKWKNALFVQKKILSEKMLRKATIRQNYLSGAGKVTEFYGYGFRIEENPKLGTLIYHGGLWHGYQNVFVYRPQDDLYILFLSNFRNGAHLGISNKIIRLLDGA
jgi:CubicO group peptidase (beta-lactamase class C family)